MVKLPLFTMYRNLSWFYCWLAVIDLSGNYVTANTFQLRTTLNRVDFKFISHRPWSEAQDIFRQHMHKK